MRSYTHLYQLLFVGAVLTLSTGCETTKTAQSNPGNLPRHLDTDYEPRVSASTYFAHGHLLERQNQYERAAVQYRKALLRQPDFVSAMNRLGITLNKLGRHVEATELFRQALVHEPRTAHLRNNLGFSLYLEQRYAEAAAEFEHALSIQDSFARAHTNYALTLAKLGRFDEAYVEFTQGCEPVHVCYNMGVVLTEAERYAEAAHYFEAALDIRPDYEAARVQLREVSRLAAEWEARQAALKLAADQERARLEAEEAARAEQAAKALTDAQDEQAARLAAQKQSKPTTPEAEDAEVARHALHTLPSEPNPCDESNPDRVAVVWQYDQEWLDAWTQGDDWHWVQTLAFDAPWNGYTSEIAETQLDDSQWIQEPGVKDAELIAMIDEAARALNDERWEEFDAIWCRMGYYLFPETAPHNPEAYSDWLADQRDLEAAAERPVAK